MASEDTVAAAAQAAYLQNLQYRALNAPATLSAQEQSYAAAYAAQQDAQKEAEKQQAAFAQARDDTKVSRSAEFERITAEYAASRNRVVTPGGVSYQGEVKSMVNPYPAGTAAAIAWEVKNLGGGGAVESGYATGHMGVAEKALAEGAKASDVIVATGTYIQRPSYAQETLTTKEGQTFVNPAWSGVPIRQNIAVSELANYPGISIESGISTVAKPTLPSESTLPTSIKAEKTVAGTFSSSGITFVPYGEYRQTALENTKLAINKVTGEVGIYQYDERTGRYNLISSGSRAALQSGMFSVDRALTPWVFTQESGGAKLSKYADAISAAQVEAAPEKYSRLGAEAYGGYVSVLDSRLLGPSAMISSYADKYNLANLVSPMGVNLGKAEAPGSKVPWSISAESPRIQEMNQYGLTGVAIKMPETGRIVSTAEQFKGVGPTVTETGAAPSVSRQDIIAAAIDITLSKSTSPIISGLYSAAKSAYLIASPVIEPVRGNVLTGLELYTYKKEAEVAQEKLSASGYETRVAALSKQQSEYESSLSKYSSDVASFSSMVSKYESEKNTMPYEESVKTYGDLKTEQSKLSSRASELEMQRSEISSAYQKIKGETIPYENAQKIYAEKAAAFVGATPTTALATYPVASPFLEAGKTYAGVVTEPFASYLQPLEGTIASPLKSAAVGFVGVPGGALETVGMSIAGGERVYANLQNLPGLAAAGFTMQAESIMKDPVKAAAGLAGTYLLFEGAGLVTTKGIGVARTVGKEYIPIERIGYEPDVGIPLAPRGTTKESIMASFEQKTLIPAPERASIAEQVPYVPRETGLPTDIQGAKYMWTAWTRTPESLIPITQRITGGKEYTLAPYAPEGSELSGMYGSSVLQTYFAKIGGQTPESIGFTLGLKTPTAVRTKVVGFEYVPGSISKEVIQAKAAKVPTREAYAPLEEYVQQNIGAGRAYLPMTKVEYEAVLQGSNILRTGASKYYTKVGGFGESHFLGTRIPIVEQEAIGRFGPRELTKTTPQIKAEEYSYRPSPMVSIESSVLSMPFSMGYARYSQRDISSRMAEQILAPSPSRTLRESKPFSEAYGVSSSPISTKYSKPYSVADSYISRYVSKPYKGYSYEVTPSSRVPERGVSPRYYGGYASISPSGYSPQLSLFSKPSAPSAPSNPSKPTEPVTPEIPPPFSLPKPGVTSSGGAGGGGRLSAFAFKEILPVRTAREAVGGRSRVDLTRGFRNLNKKMRLI